MYTLKDINNMIINLCVYKCNRNQCDKNQYICCLMTNIASTMIIEGGY